ncbi:MAG TPA: hypothetical protein VHY35_05225 [Stellaceae bacterium]|jgi:hypothetical protein|nr:hypothetical protein [Stellaceae bacterium]
MKIGAHKRKELRFEDKFTFAGLRKLFVNDVRREGVSLPTDEAMQELVRALEGQRYHNYLRSTFACRNNASAKVHKALSSVELALQELEAEDKIFLEMALRSSDSPSVRISINSLHKRIGELRVITSLIDSCRKMPALIEITGVGSITYSDCISWLRPSFTDAMRSTDPDFDNDAAFHRFIAAVAPQLTGESPSVGSVKKKLDEMIREAGKIESEEFSLGK